MLKELMDSYEDYPNEDEIGLIMYMVYDYRSDVEMDEPNTYYGDTFEEIRDNFNDLLQKYNMTRVDIDKLSYNELFNICDTLTHKIIGE